MNNAERDTAIAELTARVEALESTHVATVEPAEPAIVTEPVEPSEPTKTE